MNAPKATRVRFSIAKKVELLARLLQKSAIKKRLQIFFAAWEDIKGETVKDCLRN